MAKLKYNSKFMIQDYPELIKFFASVNPLHLSVYVIAFIFGVNYYLNDFSLALYGLGILYWSFLEYSIHRWVYHTNFKNKFLKYFLGSFHQYHHSNLKDHRILNSGLLMILVLTPAILSPFTLILNKDQLLSMTLGLISYYFIYECVHFLIHYREYRSGYMKFIQQYHMHHHDFAPLKNFGNTTALWDILLGTYDANYKNYFFTPRVKESLITYLPELDFRGEGAKDYNYLFLGGILGEILSLPFVGNYLKINLTILNHLGVPKEQLSQTTFSSFSSSEVNAKKILKACKQNFRKNGKKTIVVAHSKAGVEVLLCVLQDLAESKAYIHKVICSQAPFRGSSLFVNRQKTLFDLLSYNLLKSLCFIPGVKCLDRDYYTDLISEQIMTDKETRDFIQDHFLVIRSYKTNPAEVSWILKLSYLSMAKSNQYSDGLVTNRDQIIPYAKYREITLDIDHSDLFTSPLLSTKSNTFRTEYMVTLIDEVLSESSAAEIQTPEILQV